MDKHCLVAQSGHPLLCRLGNVCSARHWMASVPQSSISSCFCAVMPAFCLYWGCSSAFFFAPVGFLPRMCWKGYNPWPSVQNEPRISLSVSWGKTANWKPWKDFQTVKVFVWSTCEMFTFPGISSSDYTWIKHVKYPPCLWHMNSGHPSCCHCSVRPVISKGSNAA